MNAAIATWAGRQNFAHALDAQFFDEAPVLAAAQALYR